MTLKTKKAPEAKDGMRIGQYAKWYDELPVGYEWNTCARTITETDFLMFSGFTGTQASVYLDDEFSQKIHRGKRVFEESGGMAIAIGLESRLAFREGTGVAILTMSWDVHAPINIGDTLYVHEQIVDKRLTKKSGYGIITFSLEMVNQHDQVIQSGSWQIMMRRAPTISF